MRYKKTPQDKRGTYILFDDNGKFVTEYKPGEDGITEVDILNLHRIDDHEVYINSKENKLPEWYQPIYDEYEKTSCSSVDGTGGDYFFDAPDGYANLCG